MSGGFADHFSAQAGAYARARPEYPAALFAWLSTLVPRAGTRRVWDCGTGSGQAACALAGFFGQVVATDASLAQLRHAARHPRVAYVAATAERAPIAAGSVALVTVAQALHWFDPTAFRAEVVRVSTSDAYVAAWTYGRMRVDPDVDAVLDAFHDDTVGPYWPPERRHVDAGYRTLAFPFAQRPAPAFGMSAEWTMREALDYVGTWSATAAFRRARGADPLPELADALGSVWPKGRSLTVSWPLTVLAGPVHG